MRSSGMRPGMQLRGRNVCVRVVAAGPQASPPKPPSRRQSAISAASQLSLQERLTLQEGLSFFRESRQQVVDSPPRQSASAPAASGSKARNDGQPRSQELTYFFSYGTNMSCETVAKREVSISARDPAFVVDPSVKLVFKHRGGQATLESLPEGREPLFKPLSAGAGQPCVHGVLYRLPVSDLKHLHSREQGYVLTQMEVETYEGERHLAHVFVSGGLSKLAHEVTPPELYMSKLRDGAAFQFLDPWYQAWLSSISTVTSAGLPPEYFNTPGRYLSYSLLTISFAIVCGFIAQHI